MVLNWLLIPKFNGVGAAVATGISYMVFFWSRVVISRKLWYKFPLGKFLCVSVLLVCNAFINSFVYDNFILILVNIVSLIIILLLFINLIKEMKRFMEKSINVGLICYKTQSRQFSELINHKNIKCNTIMIEGESTKKNFIKLLQMVLFCDIIYIGHGCHRNSKVLKILLFFKKKIILHWIGSDVLSAKENISDVQKIQKMVIKNLACSELISEELKQLNIEAQVIPVLPSNLSQDISVVPDKHSVLSYIPEGKENFYGLEYIKLAAIRYEELDFYIVGNSNDCLQLGNVHFMGKLSPEDMNKLYNKCSILIRLPEHDGLSLMLLEALLKGKNVIYCYDFPFCERVSNEGELYSKIDKIINSKPKMNINGRNYVLKTYNANTIKNDLNKIILSCLEENNE